jgi:AmmeMemoRadiSam system protein B
MNPISLTNLPWKTAFGMVKTDETLVKQLQEVLNIRLDPEAFTGEHSISIHMDLIKYYFPKAKVVPIMIQSGASFNMIEKLSSMIYPCFENNRTLVVLSMDFSHKCTVSDAEKYDSFTHDIIANKNIKFVPRAHIDCKACLAAMLMLMNQFRDLKLEFLDHSNSAIISHKPDLLNVTSYYVILWRK